MAEQHSRTLRASASVFAGTAVAYAALEVASRCVQAGAIFLLASRYPKEQFGSFYAYFTVYQLVPVLSTAGLVESMMLRLGSASVDAEAVFSGAAKRYSHLAIVVCGAIFCSALLLSQTTSISIDWPSLVAATIGGAIYGAISLRATYQTLCGSNRSAIKTRATYLCATFGCGLVVALALGSALAFYLGLVGASVLVFSKMVSTDGWWKAGPSVSAGEEIQRASIWYVVPTILNWVVWYGVVLVAAQRFGRAAAADVAVVNNAVAVPLVIHTAVSQAWLARYLDRHKESWAAAEQRNAVVYRIQSIAILAAVLGIIVIFEIAKSADIAFIRRYANIDMGLITVLFGLSISSPYFGAVNSFTMGRRGRELAMVSIGAFVLTGAMAVTAMRLFGLFGLYLSLATFLIVRALGVVMYARRYLSGGFFDLRVALLNLALLSVCVWYYR